jgi:hypothetical protein
MNLTAEKAKTNRKIAPPRCPTCHLTGRQSFSLTEASFFLAKSDVFNVCYSCRNRFSQAVREAQSEPPTVRI